MTPARWRSNLALFCICFFWGTTYVAMAEGVEAISPALLLSARFLIAGAVLLLVSVLSGIPIPRSLEQWKRMAVMAILALVLGNYLVGWAVKEIESGLASVLIGAMPFFFVGLCAWGGEKAAPRAWAGIVIGFAGMLAMFWPELRHVRLNRAPVYYVSAATVVFTSLLWAIASFYIRKRPITCHKMMSVAAQNVLAGALLIPVGLATGEFKEIHIPLKGWLSIAYLIVFGTWVAYGSYMYALEHLSAAKISLHAYVNPVVAVGLGWLLRGERLGYWPIVGTGLILIGMVLVNSTPKGQPAAEEVTGTVEQAAG